MDSAPEALRRSIDWHDLLTLSATERLREFCLPLPWLVGTIWMSQTGRFGFALVCTFFLFLTLLRVAHNGYHYALGLSPRTTDRLLVVMSGLMMVPLHAVKYTHLEHHRHAMGPGDIEGGVGRGLAWRAVIAGPLFPLRLIWATWRRGSGSDLTYLMVESVIILALIIAAIATNWVWLDYHVIVMLIGECFTAFFAVWIVHRDTDHHVYPARTQRGRFKNAVSYQMFRHAEHHMFPRVPTCHLPELSRRIDQRWPELAARQVI